MRVNGQQFYLLARDETVKSNPVTVLIDWQAALRKWHRVRNSGPEIMAPIGGRWHGTGVPRSRSKNGPRRGLLFECARVEELQSRDSLLECRPGELPLVEQIELIPSDLLCAQLVRRLVEVAGVMSGLLNSEPVHQYVRPACSRPIIA